MESVRIDNGAVTCATIGDAPMQGICGSGLIDLLAELRRNEIMNELGAFENGVGEFVFAPEQRMSLSRADISGLAQAKSANYSGQYIVLRNYGMPIDRDLQAVSRGRVSPTTWTWETLSPSGSSPTCRPSGS